MSDWEKSWYRLDNAGKLFPSIATDRFTTVFRMSATLNKPVDTEILQLALNHLIERTPYYQVHLKRGFFWYYFERTTEKPQIEKERYYPCIYLPFRKNGTYPFRVLYYNRKISLEMTHCLSDGSGAIVFLKSLLVEYFKIKGISSIQTDGILYPGDDIDPAEHEDAFKKYYIPDLKQPGQLDPAMHFPFPLTDRGQYHIVTGIMPVRDVIKRAKEQGVTLTTLFLSLYFQTILEFIDSSPAHLKKSMMLPITMNVPVNLRTLFPSKTMRNFFLSATPTIDPRDSKLDIDTIMQLVTDQMQKSITKENLLPYISRNIQSETAPIIRIMPLIVKDAFMPLIYNLLGENTYSTSISNIGRMTIPEPLQDHIERFDFYPSPSGGNMIKTTMVSFNDKLYFSLGKVTRVTVIERLFFRKLVRMGIPVKIEAGY